MANKSKKKEDDLFLLWLSNARGLSENTIYCYRKYYKHLEHMKITQENVNAYLQRKKNNPVARGCVRSLLIFLYENKLLKEKIIMPPNKKGKKVKRIIRDFSKNQIQQVRDYSYKVKFTDGILFDLLYYGAIRREEIVKIKINSFNWAKFFDDYPNPCRLLIYGKGKKQREVLIPVSVIDRLWDEYKRVGYINDEMDLEYIVNLLSSNNSPLFQRMSVHKVWLIIKRNSLRSIGIGIRPHELRHSRATELENKGAEIRTIQHYLGHSNPQVTEIYLHTTQTQSLNKMMNIVNNEN